MPRYNIQVFAANPDGTLVDGAVVTVTGRNPATPVAVYSTSSAPVAMATPILTSLGQSSFWVDDLIAYNVDITGTGFGPYTTYVEAVTAERVKNLFLTGPGGGAGTATSTPFIYTGANKFTSLSPALTSAMIGKASAPTAALDVTTALFPGQPAASFTGIVTATPGFKMADSTYTTSANRIFRTINSFGISGSVSTPTGEADFLPPFFISLSSKETINLVKARYMVHQSTTPVILQVQKNDQAIPGYITLAATATPTETLSTVSVADNDRINLFVTFAGKSVPTNLSFTLVFEHTVSG